MELMDADFIFTKHGAAGPSLPLSEILAPLVRNEFALPLSTLWSRALLPQPDTIFLRLQAELATAGVADA